ncbi:hypothetical protein E2C01_008550 [Portunus trituberculatus]|uniref:Uncharacterized protein n=1 Tax=Portunus trituberculatus TaxID=210409 RepID=A0A5B7D2N8_PORTR|nr:hypothetical protein [Portunus trituberculatus]
MGRVGWVTSRRPSCIFDYQCPDDHGCCYDHCLQEYKCSRLLPHASTTTPTPRLSHHHEDETRVERSLQEEEQPAAVQETLATSQTQASTHTLQRYGRHGEETRLAVMVDEEQPGSGQHLLQLLTHLQQPPSLPILFLPLHPLTDDRKTVWEVVQCAAQAALEQKAALHLVGCVLTAPPPRLPQLDSLLSTVKQCGRDHRVSWMGLQLCAEHGEGRGMLRDALLRHARLLQTARTRQMTAARPAIAILAVNGVFEQKPL